MQDSPQLAKATIGEEGVNPLDPGDGNAPSNLIEYKQEGEEGSSPGNIQHSQTSLSWAEMGGQEAVVRLLLEEKGADIEMKDNLGYTALVWASSEGHISTVQQLLEKDAEIEAVDKVYGQTPLSWAAENGHEAVVQLLLEKGADIESKDASGFTPLLWAAYNGRKAVVQLLLKNGANIEAVDKEYGLTPLSWAIEHGRKALVQLLLENKADTKANDICSLTPLVRAASQGNKAIVQLLLEKGANTESNDGSGFTPLLVAARNGSKAVVQLLLENGADIEAKDNEHSRTPLSWAAGNGYKDVVRLLLEKGADTEAKDEHGWTPLSYATQNGRQAIVQLLESLEDFYGEEAGENALDWDGERGWKPVGSLRAVGLYNKGQYTRGQLLSGEWIRIVDTKFCQEFAAQVQQYDSNPWNNLVEYVVIEQVLEYVDVSDGLEYADVEDRVEYLDIDDEATENGEHDIPTTKKLCQSPGCSVEMFSEWPETCTGKLKINVLDLRSRAELCDACDLCYRCLSRHDLGGQEEVTLFQKGSMLTLGTESQPVLEIVARPDFTEQSACMQIGLHKLPKIGSDTYFELLRCWLKNCDGSEDHKHWGCHRESGSILPSRVLDVGEGPSSTSLRLYRSQLNEHGEYIALSHCWGKLPPAYLDRVHTLKCNIAARLEQIDMEDLPQNFRDAITVTRKLKKRYLWIDSLCIIQDDDADWEREARTMEKVYSMAYCTLAATSAQDSNIGFLRRRPQRRHHLINRTAHAPFYVCEPIDKFSRDVEKGILNSRGWVFQERCLSRRIIHFTDTQTYWECGVGVRCETLALMYSLNSYVLGDPAFPASLGYRLNNSTYDFVELLVQLYTKLNLTKNKDRAVAFAGIEQRLTGKLYTEMKYGLAKQFLHRSLLWQRAGDTPLTRVGDPEDRNIPSWSWMAWDGEIGFVSIYQAAVSWNMAILFPSNGELRVRIRKLRGGIERNGKISVSVDSPDDEDEDSKRGWLRLDGADDELTSVSCVVVGIEKRQWGRDETLNMCYVLLVRSVEDLGEKRGRLYERVGIGFIHRRQICFDENVVVGGVI